MNLSFPGSTLIAIMVMTVSLSICIISDEGSALPPNYPVWLSGGYAVEQPNSTTYVDYLQPGSTENYLIHLINDKEVQVRYRVTITDAPDDWLVFLGSTGDEVLVNVEMKSSRAVDLNMKAPTEKEGTIEVLVREEGTQNTWGLTLEIICQRGPLTVSVPSTNYALGRDTPSVFDIDLKNSGNTVLNVTLSMEGMATSQNRIKDSWTVRFSQRDLSVPPGSEVQVTATVWPPELEPVGSQKVARISADVNGITRPFTSLSLTFKVQTIYDLKSNVIPAGYQLISPGKSVEFTITLENWAIDYDTVTLSEYEKPSGWDMQFNDSMDPTTIPITIDPEGERTFHPVIFTPNNAVAGRHEVILRAEGTSNITEIRLKVQIARRDSFEISTLTESGSDNIYRMTVGENIIPVKVVNRGNFFDTIRMEIETRPDWAPLSFYSMTIGSGSNETTVMGGQGVNVSNQFNRKYLFSEDPLTALEVTFDPSQTATVYLRANIPLGATASSGVVTLKYKYGIFQEQKVLQAAIKLILADMEIVDMDGDGGADLDVDPQPDYKVGDTINFMWTLKNNYPYETSGLKWSIELSGKVLIEGEVPPIGPGQSLEFNESWKADRSTKYYNVAKVRISGSVYPSDSGPTANTDEKIYIDKGPGEPRIGLMILFGGIMVLIITGFVLFYLWVRKDLEKKEAVERQKYESVYGIKQRPSLGGSTDGESGKKRAMSLGSAPRPGLPSSRDEPDGAGEMGKGKPSKDDQDRSEKGMIENKREKRKASSLEGLSSEKKGPRTAAGPGEGRSKKKITGEKDLEEMEVLE